jgi:hypothetical protein
MLALIDEFDEGERRVRRRGLCAKCKRDRKIAGRNLCTSCYVIEQRYHRLDDWPRQKNTIEEVAARARAGILASESLDDIAAALGMTKGSLHVAMHRARKAGILEATSVLITMRKQGIRS